MSISTSSACNVVPFLSRLVLAAAFVTAGWAKLGQTTFEGDAAATLQRASIGTPKRAAPVVFQDGEAAAGDDEVDRERPAEPDAPSEPPVTPGDLAVDTESAPVAELVDARKLHGITLMLIDRDIPAQYAPWLAWAAVLTELVGGALLLVGLFSRIWGLGLAITMVVAFYLTSLDVMLDAIVFKLAIPDPFNQVYNQLGLFVLSFGIFLTGPGAFSLDRILFRGGSAATVVEHAE
jgi:uncharacterized membrane protein YphA (DoxX/SURF4 family)